MQEYKTDGFVAVDIETTGLNPVSDRIIEIGAVRVKDGQAIAEFDTLVNPERELGSFITELTGITDAMLTSAPDIESALREFLAFAGEGSVLLGHNISFDYSFLKKNMLDIGEDFERRGVDTLKIARKTLPELKERSLTVLCEYYQIQNERAHRACDDAKATLALYFRLKKEFYGREEETDRLFVPEPLVYPVKKDSPITAAQLKYLRALLRYHGLTPEKEPESLTKSEASRQIDKIILAYGNLGKIPSR